MSCPAGNSFLIFHHSNHRKGGHLTSTPPADTTGPHSLLPAVSHPVRPVTCSLHVLTLPHPHPAVTLRAPTGTWPLGLRIHLNKPRQGDRLSTSSSNACFLVLQSLGLSVSQALLAMSSLLRTLLLNPQPSNSPGFPFRSL